MRLKQVRANLWHTLKVFGLEMNQKHITESKIIKTKKAFKGLGDYYLQDIDKNLTLAICSATFI